jgi:Holin of 3TMs, for gene-transfer release
MALITDPVSEVAGLATTVINKIWPDKSAEEAQAIANQFALIQGQLKVNEAEASNTNWFVAGWRPYIGWICGTGLAYQFLVYPILIAFVPKIVQLDMGTLITLLSGMLGFGVLRTAEKIKGVA